MSESGQQRKSATTFVMSVKPPKAEVARRQWHFRYVPLAEVAMPVEEPSTASKADFGIFVLMARAV